MKAWAGADGQLCDYRRPANHVVVKRRHPSETGWLDRLYTIAELAKAEQDVIEREFFLRVDQEAADALAVFRRGSGDLPEKLQIGWARFLMSLMHRHPGQIQHLRKLAEAAYLDGIEAHEADYLKIRAPNDPSTFAEWRTKTDANAIAVLFARALQSACDSENVGKRLLSMRMQIASFHGGERLITSDRPLLRGQGLDHPEALLILPIGPRQLFVATNGVDAGTALRWLTKGREVVPTINSLSARQAFRHVYGVCENHLALVEREMGKGLAEPWRLLIGRPESFDVSKAA